MKVLRRQVFVGFRYLILSACARHLRYYVQPLLLRHGAMGIFYVPHSLNFWENVAYSIDVCGEYFGEINLLISVKHVPMEGGTRREKNFSL